MVLLWQQLCGSVLRDHDWQGTGDHKGCQGVKLSLAAYTTNALPAGPSLGSQKSCCCSFPQFFTQYLTPEERTDVIIVLLEAMASAKTDNEFAGSQIMNMLLKHSLEEIGKVVAPGDSAAPGQSFLASLSRLLCLGAEEKQFTKEILSTE